MSHTKTKIFVIIGLLVALGVFLAVNFSPTAAQTATPTAPPTTAAPQPTATPKPLPTAQFPFVELWSKSGHNAINSPAFNHWDTTADKAVEVACAKCHSGVGFQDFVGADGSKAGSVEKAPAVGATITCTTCHNTSTQALSSVTFPSGLEVKGLGREAVCMTCHQGAASGKTVDDQIKKLNITDEDVVMPNSKDKPGLTFTNIHYFAAAITRYGKLAAGGYPVS